MQNEKYSLPRGKSFLEKIGLKYMFDWGSGVCVWTTNDAGKERFKDYPVETSLLPISEELKNHLEHLISWYDEALDWDNPGGDLLWSEKQIARHSWNHIIKGIKTCAKNWVMNMK